MAQDGKSFEKHDLGHRQTSPYRLSYGNHDEATDEPSLGLSPNYLELVFDKLVEINKNGTSILLVEQNASEALEIAHRGYVFSIGEIVLEDTGKNLLRDEKVKKSFLGG